MREIKFRGYDLDSKSWIYGNYIKHLTVTPCMFSSKEEADKFYKEHTKHLIAFDGFSDWWMSNDIKVCTTIDEKSIGQYTGIKDKNKKEIYEGDIVKITSLDLGLDKYDDKVGTVVFNQCAFWIVFEDNSILLWRELLEYEVIGNTYEK